MALSYITSIEVGIKTLVVCIVCQVIGAYIGPKFVVKLPERTIKLFVSIGLIVAAILIFAGQMNWIPSNGTATELYGGKLILAGVLLFVFWGIEQYWDRFIRSNNGYSLYVRSKSCSGVSNYDGGMYVFSSCWQRAIC